jgi:hypothetical protein
LLTTGCSQQDGTPERTPSDTTSATPTPPPPPVVDAIELHAEEFQLFAGDEVVATLSLSDTETSVADLSELLGQPHTESVTPESTGNYCTIPHTSYLWGDALLLLDFDEGNDILSDYDVRIRASTVASASAEPVALRAAGGVTIGDDISAQLQATPDLWESFEMDGVTHSILILERGFIDLESDDGAIFGVAAFSEDGIVDTLGSPVPIHSSADC